MNVVLGTITYGPVDPHCAHTLRQSMMFAANRGVRWYGDFAPDRMAYGAARNHVVESLQQWDWEPDGIVWVDSDIMLEQHSIWKMLKEVEDRGVDFFTGVYHQRKGNHSPLLYTYVPERDTFRQFYFYTPDLILNVKGCGFGFVYTSSLLLQAITTLPTFDQDKGAWFPDRREGYGKFGEDLGFCKHAINADIPLFADTGNIVGHMGDGEVIGRDQYLAKLPKELPIPK